MWALGFSIVSLLTAFAAAGLWYWASTISNLPDYIDKDRPEEATPGNFNFDLILGLLGASTKSSRINRWAAIITGLSVILGAGSTLLGALHL